MAAFRAITKVFCAWGKLLNCARFTPKIIKFLNFCINFIHFVPLHVQRLGRVPHLCYGSGCLKVKHVFVAFFAQSPYAYTWQKEQMLFYQSSSLQLCVEKKNYQKVATRDPVGKTLNFYVPIILLAVF
jgi:hypothetical protein